MLIKKLSNSCTTKKTLTSSYNRVQKIIPPTFLVIEEDDDEMLSLQQISSKKFQSSEFEENRNKLLPLAVALCARKRLSRNDCRSAADILEIS